ncbi:MULTISPECIES: hypothetical protein [unclassified Shinella]|uniref:hypothetical protein n=1 Tax=unclassified Shinella TaxID=2643062 RepID=UPI00225DB26A|nr:conserved hypothetical protein [Rhizobiaceae bacterium]CAK7259092.1 Large polyvalent protein associated domain-containing protein [Shinella sp. WSC3-e]
MMEAELFDGTVLEFPDGTDPAVIQRVVKEQTLKLRGGTQPEDQRDQSGVPGGVAVATPTAVQPVEDDGWLSAIMSGLDYADDTAAIGLTGARQGASTVLGLPVDAVNNLPRIANLIPGVDGVGPISEKPFLGSEYIDAIMGAPTDLAASGYNAAAEAVGSDSRVAGSEGPTPQDAFQRGAHRIGREVGAAAVPVGGAMFAAGRMGVDGARAMGGPIGNFIESAAVNPAAFAGKEATIAIGAGTGAAAANELVDPSTSGGQLADLFGALAGAGITGAAGMLARGGRDVLSAFSGNPHYASRVVGDNVADTLIRNSDVMNRQVDPSNLTAPLDTQALIDAIRQPSQAEKLVPGFRASTADHAADAGLASLEAARARANPGPYRQRADQNAIAVEETIAGMRPDETPAALRDALAIERDRRMNEAIMGRQDAELAAADAVRRVTPESTAAQRGNVVRTELETARDAARQRTEDAYREANVAGLQVDPAPLAQSLDEAVAGLTEVERGLIPEAMISRVQRLGRPVEDGPQATGILDASGNPIMRDPAGPENIALKEATDLKSELQRLQRAALADPRAEKGGRNAARVLGDMIKTVDDYIGSNLTPEQQAALDTARGAKFDEAEAFTRQGDPVATALARNEGGMPKVRDDRVAGLFVDPQSMNRLFAQADTPATRRAIRDEVLSKGDTSSAERLTRFSQDYAEQLSRFPGLADEIAAAARARTAEAGARENVTRMERDLGTDTQPGRGTVGRYLQFSDANAERAINEVMAAKDPGKAADELLTFVGDDATAVQGARAAFWKKLETDSRSRNENATTESGIAPWVPRKMLAFLDDPAKRAVAERLYKDDPQHLADIRTLANALRSVNTGAKVGNATNPSGTALMMKGQPPVTLAEVGSKGYQAQTGRASWAYIGTYLAGKLARGYVGRQRAKAFELLLDKALTDKDVAASLLMENNPANRAALARKAKGWLGNEAATFVDLMSEDDDETNRAIMEDR